MEKGQVSVNFDVDWKKLNFFKKFWKEILFLFTLVILYHINPQVGATYLSLEIIFGVSIGLAFYYRYKQNYKYSFRYYLLNRLTGFLQPVVTLFVMLAHQLHFSQHWFAYSLVGLDIVLTVSTVKVFADHFTALRVRPARLSDIDGLIEIEQASFNEEQQATREQVYKRLRTQPGCCLVAEHRKMGVVGSLYVRPVNKDYVVNTKKNHKAIQNDDDFSLQPDHDALYVVGLQAKKVKGVSIATYLEGGLARYAIQAGYNGVLGGPRLPEYHLHSHMGLDDFMNSEHAKFLNYLKATGNIKGINKLEVLCGLEDYFPDPESLNCAALTWWSCAFAGFPQAVKNSFAEMLYWAVVAK